MIKKEIEAIEMIIDTETEKETGIEKETETETEIEKWTNRRGNISQVKKTIEMIDISKEKKEATPLIDHIMTITNLTFQIQEITRSALMKGTKVNIKIIQAKIKIPRKIIKEGIKNDST